MAKTTARLNKAASLAELDERLEAGRRLLEAPVEDAFALASAAVSRLEWQSTVTMLLPRLAKGMEAAADFHRASAPGAWTLDPSLAEGVGEFRQGMRAQIESLERTRERIRKIGTRTLNGG